MQRGFVLVLILIGVLVLALTGGVYYFTKVQKTNFPLQTAKSQVTPFKFTDNQPASGRFCGGFAANLPENQCPSGYTCQLDNLHPDTGGRCVKR